MVYEKSWKNFHIVLGFQAHLIQKYLEKMHLMALSIYLLNITQKTRNCS